MDGCTRSPALTRFHYSVMSYHLSLVGSNDDYMGHWHTKSQLGISFEFPQRMDGRLSCTLPSSPVQVVKPIQHYSTRREKT
jgi:hypothetical protein